MLEENNLVDISEINSEIANNLQSFVNWSETEYQKQIINIVDSFQNNKHLKFVLLAGPSSSGKTTTARLICENFKEFNIKAKPISLDDFFVNRVNTPRWEDGRYNYESVDSIDWKLFDECMSNLLNNKKSKMPTYDFISGTKTMDHEITLEDNEIIVIEGLHSLNPVIDNFIPTVYSVKVYLSPRIHFYNKDGKEVLNGREMRFLRRLIRDAFTRGASPEHTFEMWPDVVLGEQLYIDPFKKDADFHINSIHLYEVGVYKSILKEMNLLNSPLLAKYAIKLAEFDDVDKNIVPKTSLLTEFVH